MGSSEPQPTWQPLSKLPMIAWAITGMADEAAAQVGNLREAQGRPHVLDDATVNRVIASYTEQQGDLWLYEEQLRRWQAGKPTAAQRTEIAGLTKRLAGLRADIATIVDLAAYLKPRTIDAVLARSDEELALDFLTGNRPPPWAAPLSSTSPPPTPKPAPAEYDEEAFFAEGERLTPTMRALLQIAGCLVTPEPIPLALLIAPLAPHAGPGAPEALAALLQQGWLAAPSLTTAQFTSKSRTFLAAHPSEEPIQRTVIQALCGLVGRLMKERDEATLRLVEPHLCALADAKAPRGDDHALMLYLTVGTYHTLFGDTQRARVYLERASALDAALGGSQPKPPRTPRGRR